MKLTIKKGFLRLHIVLLCYISTIIAGIHSTVVTKYGMYAFIIGVAFFESMTEKRSAHIWRSYPYILVYTAIICFSTVIAGIIGGGGINAGSLIQPIFLLSCYKLGFYVAMKYGEWGCTKVLKDWSYVFAFAAIISIPEWFFNKSFFFPNYGNSWSAFRVPSIYGHPIRLGASLTMGVAIFLFIYRKSILQYLLMALSLFGIYTCLSRSSWLACAGAMALLVLAMYRKRITKRKFLIGVLGISILIIFLLSKPGTAMTQQIIFRFEEATGDSISRTQRLGAITYILNDEWKNFNPFTFLFGHGEDAASKLMLRTTINIENFSTTDNEYLLILYNYGFVFLAIIIKGIFKCIKKFVLNYEGCDSVEKCLLFICVSQAICSFFYEVTENKSCAFLLMCCIGMLMALKKRKDSPKQLI